MTAEELHQLRRNLLLLSPYLVQGKIPNARRPMPVSGIADAPDNATTRDDLEGFVALAEVIEGLRRNTSLHDRSNSSPSRT